MVHEDDYADGLSMGMDSPDVDDGRGSDAFGRDSGGMQGGFGAPQSPLGFRHDVRGHADQQVPPPHLAAAMTPEALPQQPSQRGLKDTMGMAGQTPHHAHGTAGSYGTAGPAPGRSPMRSPRQGVHGRAAAAPVGVSAAHSSFSQDSRFESDTGPADAMGKQASLMAQAAYALQRSGKAPSAPPPPADHDHQQQQQQYQQQYQQQQQQHFAPRQAGAVPPYPAPPPSPWSSRQAPPQPGPWAPPPGAFPSSPVPAAPAATAAAAAYVPLGGVGGVGGVARHIAAPAGHTVRVPRSQAWPRIMAYEGCIQICVSQMGKSRDADHFLKDGMKALREGFGVGPLLLERDERQAGTADQQDESADGKNSVSDSVNERSKGLWAKASTVVNMGSRGNHARDAGQGGGRKNDVCWDDAELDEAATVPGPALPLVVGGPTSASSSLGGAPQPIPLGQLQMHQADPYMPGIRQMQMQQQLLQQQQQQQMLQMPAAYEREPAAAVPPRLLVLVREALKTGGNLKLLGSTITWFTQPGLQVRLSCGRLAAGYQLDKRGAALPGTPSFGIPQEGEFMSGVLSVELVCAKGLVAGGRINVKDLVAKARASDARASEQIDIPLFAPGAKKDKMGTLSMSLEWAPGQAPTRSSPARQHTPFPVLPAFAVVVQQAQQQAQQMQQMQQLGPQQQLMQVHQRLAVGGDGGGGAEAGAGAASPLPSPLPLPAQAQTVAAARSGAAPGPAAAWHEVACGTAAAVVGTRTSGQPGALGPLHISASGVMDAVLHAALKMAGCRANRLIIEGPWAWMVDKFASYFGVSEAFVLLSHIKWILRTDVATLTPHCLDTVGAWLGPLLQQERGEASPALNPEELHLLSAVKTSCQQLLVTAFEQYIKLSDQPPGSAQSPETFTGVVGAPTLPTDLDPLRIRALKSAFGLLSAMAPSLEVPADAWLLARVRVAASQRWQALLAGCRAESGIDINALLQGMSLDEAGVHHSRRTSAASVAGQPHGPATHTLPASSRGVAGGTAAGGGGGNGGGGRGGGGGGGTGPRAGHQANYLYKGLEALSKAIIKDVTYDLQLGQELASQLQEVGGGMQLAQVTTEEYVGRFVAQLQAVLSKCPPAKHSLQAVDLLVAVAGMQRFMEECGLATGQLSAIGLFHPHVCKWLAVTQAKLQEDCQQLQSAPDVPLAQQLTAAAYHGVNLGIPPPEMFDMGAVGAQLSSLVTKMHVFAGTEMEGYAQVVKHWRQFGLDLEAALCRVMEVVLETLKRKYPMPAPGSGSGGTGGQARGNHVRSASALAGNGANTSAPAPEAAPTRGQAPGQRGSQQAPLPRMEVLYNEAVLLNSLMYLMAYSVPEIERQLSGWCTGDVDRSGGLGSSLSSLYAQQQGGEVVIGYQFDQVVQELRTEYGNAITAVAERLFRSLHDHPATHLRQALLRAMPEAGAATGPAPISELLRPVFGLGGAMEAALSALHGCLEPRVFIAIGRTLWEYTGKDLHSFVQSLHGLDNAWIGRQRAEQSLSAINGFFQHHLEQAVDEEMKASVQQPPSSIAKVQKLLQPSKGKVVYNPY
ncbi:hypothetical protein FOA52_003882 [Chlamydomonas sp. UWO 241]|nr:hypothetical protein FOA52_003882 [Chlamydomonas sp. UWO 241]